jgi:hypothetical protein
MKKLFDSKIPKFTKERMSNLRTKQRRLVPRDKEYKKAYKKYKHYLKFRAEQIVCLPEEEIRLFLMCGAYALKKDMPKFLGHEERDIDYKDLDRFLNQDVSLIYKKKDKSFKKLKHGLKFLGTLTRKYYTNVLQEESGGAINDTYLALFEVCNISLHLAPLKTRMGTRRFYSTYTHASTKNRLQFASNFNPLISAYIFNNYGLKSAKERGVKEIHLHSSSEGWLGRLLASYYVAFKNPKYRVYYRSIDPNIKVVESFHKLIEILQEYKPLENWDAKIWNQGSEESYPENIKIDVSFTSPPYLDLEKYPDSVIVNCEKGTCTLSHLDRVEILSHKEIDVRDLKIGDVLPKIGRIKKLTLTKQCATLYKTARKWNQFFCKPTMTNIYQKQKHPSYLVWNVVNIRQHPTLEEDSVQIAEEIGYTLEDILRYPLVRKPASSGVKDDKGKNIRLADIKDNFEPIFVFTR